MRKIITMLLLSVMLATAGSVQAQFRRPAHGPHNRYTAIGPGPVISHGRGHSHWHDNMYFGIKLGLNASAVRSEATELNGTGVACGLNTGVAMGFYLSPYHPVSLETGLYYTEKGGKSNHAGNRFTYDLNYIEIPLVLKYKIFTPRDLAIEPFFGAYGAIGVAGKIKDYNNREAFSSFDDGYFQRGDAGLKLGCGVSYQMFSLEASYDLGLTDIGQDTFDSTHNGCFTISAGITF